MEKPKDVNSSLIDVEPLDVTTRNLTKLMKVENRIRNEYPYLTSLLIMTTNQLKNVDSDILEYLIVTYLKKTNHSVRNAHDFDCHNLELAQENLKIKKISEEKIRELLKQKDKFDETIDNKNKIEIKLLKDNELFNNEKICEELYKISNYYNHKSNYLKNMFQNGKIESFDHYIKKYQKLKKKQYKLLTLASALHGSLKNIQR
ncbi:hypothetical protein A3Q56_05319 [Intoshia linei]|uniref:Uncharacterized protein n=1 Tax=Intoshia linei TaxID=1819745 RepID=A0A177AYL4_9BILA|nr:hypothetical protein A3Q56_05319 [Intoshia linei]